MKAKPYSYFCVLAVILFFIGFAGCKLSLPFGERPGIAHLGYYSHLEGEFVFSGDAKAYEFQHEALANNEWIRLKPIFNQNRFDTWLAQYNARDKPLRIGGKCVNLLKGEGERKIQFSETISYGTGDSNSLSISLTNTPVQDPVWGSVIQIYLTKPMSWPLPPEPYKPFIITSSKNIPFDGYYINAESADHPFFVKATLDKKRVLNINDGMRKLSFNPGEIIRLGDSQHGVLMSLRKTSMKRTKKEQIWDGEILARGPSEPIVLASVHWVNGEKRRIFPEGDLFPMAYALGKACDNVKTSTNKLQLTINAGLQRSLNEAIEKYALGNGNYRDNDPLKTRILSLTVMDAFSGEVLAMPSWPYAVPDTLSFENALSNGILKGQKRYLKNHNLTNHVVSSTIKPFTFATVAAQLWPEWNLADFTFYNQADRIPYLIKGYYRHPHNKIGGLPIEPWDCHSAASPINSYIFLVHSLNYYEVSCGMLGMVLDKQDLSQVLVPNGSPTDILYKGTKYSFDLKRVAESPFILEGSLPRPRREKMSQTLLFRGMPELFEVKVSGDYNDALAEECKRFIPSFEHDGSYFETEYLDNILPEPVFLKPQLFMSVRGDLVSFLIGGGRYGRFNNIRMAESIARLVTGKRVTAKLEPDPKVANTPVKEMPAPINITEWRNNHLILPMMKAGEIGTARFLKGLVPYPYKITYKTGTIQDKAYKRRADERESETLLFVIGEWNGDSFVPGKTLACFFYMQESKKMRGEGMKKFDFAKPIINVLMKYLWTLNN